MEKVEFIIRLRARGEKSESAIKAAYKSEFGNLKTYPQDKAEAKKAIAEYFQKNVEALAEDVALHLWDLYSKNYKLQDYRECRAILKQITDLTATVNETATVEKKEENPILKQLFPNKAANE